ncbi:hypothetical protein DSO57_1005492 [Entomophthora muscae]|uniref:Uncharacterized protein n=1 Tax=Entomophthora muscae TaxID=34485 RepID=A0ACC2U6K5_9FUNG|nr:hypothetical protein DSO57_1005492 [Entomophthora muscae]
MKINWGLGILLVEGLRYPVDTLYQKQQTLDPFRFSDLSPRPKVARKLGINPNVASPGAKFEFSLESSEDPSRVSQLVTALQIAGGFIENALNLANKIVVNVCFNSNCPAFKNLQDKKKKLARCIPEVKVEFLSAGEPIIFPYALLNQKHTRENDFDMILSIQPRDDFLMPVDYGSDKDQVFDATETIIHEILHGMGISSFVNLEMTGNPKYNGPYYNIENKKDFKSICFAKGIYDKHLHSGGKSMHNIVQSMSKNLSYMEADAYVQEIPKMPQLQQIQDFFTGKSPVYLLTTSKKIVHIQTTKNGNSLGHLSDVDYALSLDHLMTRISSEYSDVIQKKTLVQGWLTAPLGNNTIDILETLGYKKNPSPQREKSQLGLYEEMQKYN